MIINQDIYCDCCGDVIYEYVILCGSCYKHTCYTCVASFIGHSFKKHPEISSLDFELGMEELYPLFIDNGIITDNSYELKEDFCPFCNDLTMTDSDATKILSSVFLGGYHHDGVFSKVILDFSKYIKAELKEVKRPSFLEPEILSRRFKEFCELRDFSDIVNNNPIIQPYIKIIEEQARMIKHLNETLKGEPNG